MTTPEFDLASIRYCEKHESHWITNVTASEKGASCPWCQRDVYWDELENIHDVFLSAVRSVESKGGQHVPYFGDFADALQIPSTLRDMRQWIKRWDEFLGKNAKRGEEHEAR